MKKTLIFIALAMLSIEAKSQHSYISASGNIILSTGSIERYSSPDIYVDAYYNTIKGTWLATLSILATGATTDIIKTHQIEFDDATIDAFTPTGATPTQEIKNCILQAVEANLVALNGSVFTLN